MKNHPEHIQGLIFATIGALALTPDGLLVRLVGTNDWAIVFWRGLFICIGLFIAQLVMQRKDAIRKFPPQNRKEWFGAIIAALGALTFVLGITHTTVANALVILSTMSLFAALLSMIFLKERIAKRTWVAMACAFFGIVIVFMDNLDGDGMAGKFFALSCAFFTAAYMTVVRSDKSINVPSVFAWGGLLVMIPAFFFAPSLAVNAQASMTLVGMGSLNAFAFVCIGAGAKRIPAPEVSLLMLLETILGPVWVWFVLSEEPSTNAIIGGAIVVSTLALHSIATLKARRA